MKLQFWYGLRFMFNYWGFKSALITNLMECCLRQEFGLRWQFLTSGIFQEAYSLMLHN